MMRQCIHAGATKHFRPSIIFFTSRVLSSHSTAARRAAIVSLAKLIPIMASGLATLESVAICDPVVAPLRAAVVWFRRDLRLTDHEALSAVCGAHVPASGCSSSKSSRAPQLRRSLVEHLRKLTACILMQAKLSPGAAAMGKVLRQTPCTALQPWIMLCRSSAWTLVSTSRVDVTASVAI